MKLKVILVFFTLSLIVEGMWSAAAIQPIILSLGAVFSAIDLDVLDIESIQLRNLLTFKNKKDEEWPNKDDNLTLADFMQKGKTRTGTKIKNNKENVEIPAKELSKEEEEAAVK